MSQHNTTFQQILQLIPRPEFEKWVIDPDKKLKDALQVLEECLIMRLGS